MIPTCSDIFCRVCRPHYIPPVFEDDGGGMLRVMDSTPMPPNAYSAEGVSPYHTLNFQAPLVATPAQYTCPKHGDQNSAYLVAGEENQWKFCIDCYGEFLKELNWKGSKVVHQLREKE